MQMKVLQHTAETLHTALVSDSKDLAKIYTKYSKGVRRFLEEGLRTSKPDSLFQPITLHSDSDWIHAHPEVPEDFQNFYRYLSRKTPNASQNTIYIQTIGESVFSVQSTACHASLAQFYTFVVGPFGAVGAQTEQYVKWLIGYCQAFFYGLSVELLSAVSVSETRCCFRINSNSHNLQIYAGNIRCL